MIHSHLKIKSFSLASLMMVSLAFSSRSFADDETVKEGLKEAMALYTHRSATDQGPIDAVIKKLGELEGQADDSDLNYDVLILTSRALFWKGDHTPGKDGKKLVFFMGQSKADEAIKINDTYAEGHYYAGISLGRWAEANGILESIKRKPELESYMRETGKRPQRDDTPGDRIEGNGPDRVFGRMFFMLPSIMGGSHTESIKFLKRAYDQGRGVALNAVYYAETLMAGDAAEKQLGNQVLDDLLKNDPNTYNPDRVPESHEDFDLARKLRGQGSLTKLVSLD